MVYIKPWIPPSRLSFIGVFKFCVFDSPSGSLKPYVRYDSSPYAQKIGNVLAIKGIKHEHVIVSTKYVVALPNS